MLNTMLQEVKDFREKIYRAIRYRRDATFELLDALCSNVTAKSPMALSLNGCYRREYYSITDSLSEFHKGEEQQFNAIREALVEQGINESAEQNYFLLATDVTPSPRKYSPTLLDRTLVYQPGSTVSGNKPVTIGHKFSTICLAQPPSKPGSWVLPLSVARVSSQEDDVELGAKQLSEVLTILRQQHQPKLKLHLFSGVYTGGVSVGACVCCLITQYLCCNAWSVRVDSASSLRQF